MSPLRFENYSAHREGADIRVNNFSRKSAATSFELTIFEADSLLNLTRDKLRKFDHLGVRRVEEKSKNTDRAFGDRALLEIALRTGTVEIFCDPRTGLTELVRSLAGSN